MIASTLGVSRMVFGAGISLLVAFAIGLFVLAYKIVPKNKKARTCSPEEFAHARFITIPLPRGEEIVLKPDAAAFGELIANFTSETGDSSHNTFSERLVIKINNRSYTVEVSIDGWNFDGEEKNRRRLRNPLQVIETIDSLKEKYFKRGA